MKIETMMSEKNIHWIEWMIDTVEVYISEFEDITTEII